MVSIEALTRPSGLLWPFAPWPLRVWDWDWEDGSDREFERYSRSVSESELCVRPPPFMRGQVPAPRLRVLEIHYVYVRMTDR